VNIRTFRRGQFLRTTFLGRTRDQIFRLNGPVKSLGNTHGGHWWVTWLVGKHESVVLIDNCTSVGRVELQRRNLLTSRGHLCR
jgi:hypothetical protein